MIKEPIRAIVFDLGNVLIDFDHRIAAKRISDFCDMSQEKIFNLFFDSELTALFEEGKISPENFFLQIKNVLNLKLDFSGFLPIWNEIFFLTPENRAICALAADLRKRYKVTLLSNINILHFNYLKEKFSVFGAFDNITTSCEAGFRKPHPSIYKKVINDLGVMPQNIFYTDDRPELIAGARVLGIKGFTFTDAAQLRKDLISCGVNLN